MEIIRVKNAEEGGKKAFEIIKEGMNNGAKVLGLGDRKYASYFI